MDENQAGRILSTLEHIAVSLDRVAAALAVEASYKIKDEPYRDTARMLLKIAINEEDAASVVRFFEILKEQPGIRGNGRKCRCGPQLQSGKRGGYARCVFQRGRAGRHRRHRPCCDGD